MDKILTLDYHGVVSADPEYFAKLINQWKKSKGVVHLVSGLNLKALYKVAFQYKVEYGVEFNQLFSIETHLLSLEKPYIIRNGSLLFNDDDWNRVKGDYCARVGSTVHFDDTPEYEPYFSTPFILWG